MNKPFPIRRRFSWAVVPLALVLGAALTSCSQQHSSTKVAGKIETTTWSKAGSPYIVTDTVVVPAGQTLTIEAGVGVLFNADVPFIVRGQLEAVGTEEDTIYFLRGGETPWRGIRISGGDSSTIHYARISGGYARGNLLTDQRGGGIHVSGIDTRLSLANSTVSGNQADSHGGGVYTSGSVTLSEVTLRLNRTGDHGGGIYVTNGSAILNDCLIIDNDATKYSFAGAGAYNGGRMDLVRCVVTGNVTQNDGGGIGYWNSSGSVRDCLIANNRSADSGGGLYLGSATDVELVNSSIYNNSAANDGGGIALWSDGATLIEHCTVARNVAPTGGAISQFEAHSLTIRNSIVWGNMPPELHDDGGSHTFAASYSNLGWNPSGPDIKNIISVDPLFLNLDKCDLRLGDNSPCIDAAKPNPQAELEGSPADMGKQF